MLVTFSNRHCLADNPVKKAVPNSIIKDNNIWVGLCLNDGGGVWIGTTDHPTFKETVNHYNTFSWDQHRPKTVVSMVQE